jgi:outer membrane protein assembly factor BamA
MADMSRCAHALARAALCLALGCAAVLPAWAEDEKPASLFRSPDDGWLDISGFLDQVYGFVPVAIPITEPAVGYGAAAALAFIDKPSDNPAAGFGRPNITVVGGLGTENGTRGAFAGDVRHWNDERTKTLVAGIRASVNLDFYGIGRDNFSGAPRRYNLDTSGGAAQAKFRVKDSNTWVGLAYALATTTIKFDVLPAVPNVPDIERESRVGGLIPSLTYDSRDNVFTPTRGSYLDGSAGIFRKAFGGDVDFERASLTGIQYLPLDPKWALGVMGSGVFSFGDVPFYLRPYIALRGVPVMRYQGEHAVQAEAELRWQFWQRFSLVAFAGAGAAWNDFGRMDNKQTVTAGGLGFRYEIARKYGLHMGLDVARGPEDTAVYVQVGSAWMRP